MTMLCWQALATRKNVKKQVRLKRVKNRSVGNVEYVIFDIYKQKASTTSKMSYNVETASAPFTDYSGDETIPCKRQANSKKSHSNQFIGCVILTERIRTPKNRNQRCQKTLGIRRNRRICRRISVQNQDTSQLINTMLVQSLR